MRDAKYGFGSLDVLLEIKQSNDQIDRSLAALAKQYLEETRKGMKKLEMYINTLNSKV